MKRALSALYPAERDAPFSPPPAGLSDALFRPFWGERGREWLTVLLTTAGSRFWQSRAFDVVPSRSASFPGLLKVTEPLATSRHQGVVNRDRKDATTLYWVLTTSSPWCRHSEPGGLRLENSRPLPRGPGAPDLSYPSALPVALSCPPERVAQKFEVAAHHGRWAGIHRPGLHDPSAEMASRAFTRGAHLQRLGWVHGVVVVEPSGQLLKDHLCAVQMRQLHIVALEALREGRVHAVALERAGQPIVGEPRNRVWCPPAASAESGLLRRGYQAQRQTGAMTYRPSVSTFTHWQ
ncbi:hypothetical protein MYXA107069_33185 [Myxococcus xanthus]|nr:hypothetical protein MyxoNM_31525 [Myxococcus xanthus]SDX90882.1 hypothetical protein SAMN05444383_114230 [Myxococcus xanthus]